MWFTWCGHVEDEWFEVGLHRRVHIGSKACAQVRAQLVAYVLRPAAAYYAAHATVVTCTYARHTLFTSISIIFVTACNSLRQTLKAIAHLTTPYSLNFCNNCIKLYTLPRTRLGIIRFIIKYRRKFQIRSASAQLKSC